MLRLTLLFLGLVLAPVAPASEPLPEPLRGQAERLATGSQDEQKAALAELLASRDARVLPELARLLDREDRSLSQAACIGLVAAFPEQALGVFRQRLSEGTPAGRVAAAYALGLLDTPEADGLALELLADADPSVTAAAAYALWEGSRSEMRAARDQVAGADGPPPDLARLARLRRTLLERLAAGTIPRAEGAVRFLAWTADHETAEVLASQFARSLPAEEAALGAILEQMVRANSRWLGRPAVAAFARAAFVLKLELLGESRSAAREVSFTPSVLELLRLRREHLDRASHLALTLDDLAVAAERCGPRLEKLADETAEIRYKVPPRSRLVVSLPGQAGAEYYDLASEAEQVLLTVDRRRAVPLSERLFGAGGELETLIRYSDYTEVDPGRWVPGLVELEFPTGDARSGNLPRTYALRFQVVKGLWLLSGATLSELTAEGPVLRARTRVTKLEVSDR